jgi:hypothetical protein
MYPIALVSECRGGVMICVLTSDAQVRVDRIPKYVNLHSELFGHFLNVNGRKVKTRDHYIYIYVWKLNQTVLELDFWAVKFLFFPQRDLNSHHWYTAAPIAVITHLVSSHFWTLCCQSLFDLRLVITHLVSSHFWTLCCQSLFDLRLVITHLVSSHFWTLCCPLTTRPHPLHYIYIYIYIYTCI